MPTDQELAQLAEIAAEKVAKRLGARAPGLPETSVDAPLRSVAPTPQIVEIEELLRKFVAERGRNDQEIGEALSCFQDALEHILDRMDALEGTQAPNDAQQTSAASPWLDDDQAEQAAAAEAPPTRASSPESIAANVAASEIRLSRETTLQDTSPSAEAAKPSLTTMATVLSARAQPRYLMTASLAAFLLAGYWLASGPKLLPAIEAIGQRTEPGLMDREASASPAQTNARAVEEPAPRLRAGEPSAPAADEKGGNFAPEPIIRAQQPSSETQTAVEGSRQGGDNAQTARPELPSTGPSISGPVGITVQQGSASLSPEDIMRLRQRQRMASLSTRLGQEAATTSNGASFPTPTAVGTAEPVSSMSGEAEAKKILELPPAMIGPMSLRLAAARGDASAQFSVAMRFAEGKGVKQDFEQAAFWYQRAAAQGLAAAQYRLATLYERGLGVGADTGRARTWYKRAADQGNVKAMHNLAVLLAGRDGQPDYASAAKWFAEAADRGLTDSQYNLGVLHESGLGTSKDLAAAYKWFALAARGGDKEALRRRELVRSKLDAATVKVADVQISAWHPLPTESEMNDPQAAGDVWRNRAATN
jgi:localization factor PodJL